MEITGIGAVVFIVVVFLAGVGAGMLWAGWSFAMLLRRQGMTMTDDGIGMVSDPHDR